MPRCEQNQWYQTARDLDRGVNLGGLVIARSLAAWLSSKMVEMVDAFRTIDAFARSCHRPKISSDSDGVKLFHWFRIYVTRQFKMHLFFVTVPLNIQNVLRFNFSGQDDYGASFLDGQQAFDF